jgi:hypothetical protein
MNANKLAQYLEVAFYPDEDIAKASTMLRKQANEIEELEKKIKLLERDYSFMKDLAIGSEELLRKAQEK